MQKITVYKLHTADDLAHKIEQLHNQGKHPFSMAVMNGDARDFHGDPTYLLDSPVGYSTRPEVAVLPFMNQYNIVDVR